MPNRKFKNLLLVLSLGFSPYALSVEELPPDEDPKQLTVTADTVDIEDQSAVSTYTGNARASQGETYIEADKIEITHPDQEIKSVHIVGKPALVHYVSEDKQDVIDATANTIEYDIVEEILILKGKAKVMNGQNRIEADYIKVNKKTGEMHAKSGKKSRVKTIFVINNE